MKDHEIIKGYGTCPQCGTNDTEIWDADGNGYTVFSCCDCKINFDVLDDHPKYTYFITENSPDWVYITNVETWKQAGYWSRGCDHHNL